MVVARSYHYTAYGLLIQSDLALPGMTEVEPSRADVVIEQGKVDAAPMQGKAFRNWSAEPGRLLLELLGEAHIVIEAGKTIRYQKGGASNEQLLVSTLMGTGLAAILLQRELLPLHACCVKTDKGAVLVIGKSGAGKSTMLTGLLELGLPMMADDVTAIALDAGLGPQALPAFPAARLWRDTCERTGVDHSDLDQVRDDMDKYYLPITQFHAKSEPVAGIIWLIATNRTEAVIEKVEPMARVEPLRRFIYRKNFLSAFGLEAFAFRSVAALARDVPMVRVERPAAEVPPVELAQQALKAFD